MVEEYSPIMKNSIWEVVPRLVCKSVVGLRWVYKIKHDVDGNTEKLKACFLAKGFSQKEGIDYNETSASEAKYSSIKAIISIAA